VGAREWEKKRERERKGSWSGRQSERDKD